VRRIQPFLQGLMPILRGLFCWSGSKIVALLTVSLENVFGVTFGRPIRRSPWCYVIGQRYSSTKLKALRHPFWVSSRTPRRQDIELWTCFT